MVVVVVVVVTVLLVLLLFVVFSPSSALVLSAFRVLSILPLPLPPCRASLPVLSGYRHVFRGSVRTM